MESQPREACFMSDFWLTIGGQRFQAQLVRQLTRLADGIETQNGLYERLLEGTIGGQQLVRNYYGQEVAPVCPDLTNNCDNCEDDNCQSFIAKPVWLHDENGNDVLQHCRCTCTCHLDKEIAV